MPPTPRTDSPEPEGARSHLIVWARRFPPTSWGVRAARTFAAGAVEAARRGASSDRSVAWLGALDATTADVALVTSELASNAARHAATPFEVVVEVSSSSIRIEVRDGSASSPHRQGSPGGPTGRGLVVVERLASSWGAAPTARGKVVWAELPVDGASSARSDASA